MLPPDLFFKNVPRLDEAILAEDLATMTGQTPIQVVSAIEARQLLGTLFRGVWYVEAPPFCEDKLRALHTARQKTQGEERSREHHREQQTAPPQQEDFTAEVNTEPDVLKFACVTCKRKLRIVLPIGVGLYSCPSCKIRYQPVKSDDAPYVFVLVPETAKDPGAEVPPPKRPRVIPREVKAALAVFDLAETATIEDAKRAYRNAVHQYHPDKVDHLGPELKKVAEQKTKEFVASFEIIKRYFSQNEE